jgi:hypothetical protein
MSGRVIPATICGSTTVDSAGLLMFWRFALLSRIPSFMNLFAVNLATELQWNGVDRLQFLSAT